MLPWVYAITLLVICHIGSKAQQSSYFSLSNYVGTFQETYDWLTTTCAYHPDITGNLRKRLPRHILAQENAIASITSAFSSWELSKNSDERQALVLTFSGPTGVGKSETAFEVASSVVASLTKDHNQRGYRSCAFLEFRGEEFSKDSLSSGVAEARRQIRIKIVEHLRKTGGKGVIVFDETQKILPGVLEVLLPAFGKRGHIDAPSVEGSNQAPRRVSTTDCVFIFIIDMAIEQMANIIVSFGGRDLVPATVIRNEVKDYLNAHFERLKFGKVISDVIPFLPMEQDHIQQILHRRLQKLSAFAVDSQWLGLVVDSPVLRYLTDPRFIQYKNFTNPHTGNFLIAAYEGARTLDNAGPYADLKAMIQLYMSPFKKGRILHIGMVSDKVILEHQRLYKFKAQSTQQLSNFNASGYNVGTMYMQWCKPGSDLLGYMSSYLGSENFKDMQPVKVSDKSLVRDHDTCEDPISHMHPVPKMLESYFMSDACETMWYGRFICGGLDN